MPLGQGGQGQCVHQHRQIAQGHHRIHAGAPLEGADDGLHKAVIAQQDGQGLQSRQGIAPPGGVARQRLRHRQGHSLRQSHVKEGRHQ